MPSWELKGEEHFLFIIFFLSIYYCDSLPLTLHIYNYYFITEIYLVVNRIKFHSQYMFLPLC